MSCKADYRRWRTKPVQLQVAAHLQRCTHAPHLPLVLNQPM